MFVYSSEKGLWHRESCLPGRSTAPILLRPTAWRGCSRRRIKHDVLVFVRNPYGDPITMAGNPSATGKTCTHSDITINPSGKSGIDAQALRVVGDFVAGQTANAAGERLTEDSWRINPWILLRR